MYVNAIYRMLAIASDETFCIFTTRSEAVDRLASENTGMGQGMLSFSESTQTLLKTLTGGQP
jgi:nitrate reductase beta subunit